MANQTVYPYGTNGELPESVGIINDLTTGGADKALSAQQGKVIGDLLRNARLKKIDFGKLTRSNYSTYSTKKWGFTYSREQHVVLPCSPGDIFLINPTDNNGKINSTYYSGGNYYGWLTDDYVVPTSASTTPYVSGYDRTWVNESAGPHLITAPEGAAYLCLVTVNGASTNASNRCDWEVYKVEDLEEAFEDSPTKDQMEEGINHIDALPFIKVGHYSIDGNGTNYVKGSFGHLDDGYTYKVIIDDLYWVDNSVVSSSVFKFDIRGWREGTVLEPSNPIYIYRQDPLPSEFTFVALEGNTEYTFGGRCKVGDSISVTLWKQVKIDGEKVVSDDAMSLIRQAHASSSDVLKLMHFSDLHGDTTAANKIISAIDELGDNLNDTVATGDVVHVYAEGTTQAPHGTTWWQGCGLPEKVLYVLGNHDGATSSATEYDVMRGGKCWDGKGKAWDFQNYFENYISDVGYTMPTGYDDSSSPNYRACYWHKDYADAKVRLIGIDCMHHCDGIVNPETGAVTATGSHWSTNEQELWFIDKLNETLDSENDAYGYSVVVVGHYCLDPFEGDNNATNTKETGGRVIDHRTSDHTNFNLGAGNGFTLDNYGFNYRSKNPSNYANLTNNNFADILMSWKGRGGKFIAFVCGHMHYDQFYYPTNYPELLVVCINQAGGLTSWSTENRSTFADRMVANYYAIDPTNGLFKIVRVGLNKDKYLRPINFICYDYINKKVLNEG